MANTPHLGITLVSQSQSQKEVTINQAIQIFGSPAKYWCHQHEYCYASWVTK